MAMLPIGVAIAVVMALRVILMVVGAASTGLLEIAFVLAGSAAAALIARSGFEYRRTVGVRAEPRH